MAEIVRSERYVLLDAKNHLVYPLGREFLGTPAGQPRINGYSFVNDPMKEFLGSTLSYFGIIPRPHLEWFTRTTTPFTMLTPVARDLTRYLEEREGDAVLLAFQQKKLTEFFLYSGFLRANGSLTNAYDLDQPHCAQIWGETSSEAGCAEAIRKAEASNCPFLAVHSKAILRMNERARSKVASFWHARGLFPSVQDGFGFYPVRTGANSPTVDDFCRGQ